jgi:hypothetical protein
MLYRLFLPFTGALFAFLADAALLASALARGRAGAGVPARAVGLVCLAAAALVTARVGRRDAEALRLDVAWNLERNRHVDPGNLAVRFLDVVCWRETGETRFDGRQCQMPVDGRRVNWPPDPARELRLAPGLRAHYEIWWTAAVDMDGVRVLTDRGSAEAIAAHCAPAAFDEVDFRAPAALTPPRLEDFVPDPGEPHDVDYRWVAYPFRARGRALRLTCDGLPAEAALRQLEVRDGAPRR